MKLQYLRLPALVVLLAVLGCTSSVQAPPFANVDRIAIGAFHMRSHAEISNPADIAKLVSFANERRARDWSCCESTKHGPGGVLLHFYSRGEYLGYFGVQGGAFFTRLDRGDAELKPASHQEILQFLDLVPAASSSPHR